MFKSKFSTTVLTLLLSFMSFAVIAQPTFSVVFTPDTIGPGSNSKMNFTITNTSVTPVEDIAFTNTLPAGVVLGDLANGKTDCLDGILIAANGGGSIALSGGKLGAFSTCFVEVNVTGSMPGTYNNLTGDLTSSAGNSGTASDDLTVTINRPGFSKSFSPNVISVGQVSTLTFLIDNTANAGGVSTLSFSDNLPTGLIIAPIPNQVTDCGSAVFPPSITATSGTSTISLFANGFNPSFPALAAMSTCTLSIDVVATIGGVFINESNDLLAGGLSSGFAVAQLDVPVETLVKSFVDDPTTPGGTARLDFTIRNFDRNNSLSSIAFSDDLNAMVAGVTYNSLLANDCGGTVGGVGTDNINFSGATLGPQAACNISILLSVASTVDSGNYPNVTSDITGSLGGSPFMGNVATDTLSIQAAPIVTKTFLQNPVVPGDSTVLEFTVTNTSTTSIATDIAFEDILDNVLATASVTPGNNCLGAGSTCTFTPLFNPPGPCNPCDAIPARITISGGTLAPAGMAGDSATFSFTLDVIPDANTGTYPNETSLISATVDGVTRFGKSAKDELAIIAAPILTKSFIDDPVAPGGIVTLEFTLQHKEEAPSAATDITFTDDLEATITGLTANFPVLPDPPCGPGSTLTGSAGDSLLTLSGGNLAQGASCTFSITLNVPMAAAPGKYDNITSSVSATVLSQTVVSAPADDELNVSGLLFSKEFIDDPVIAGDTATLRFTIDNIHPSDDATGMLFTDNLALNLTGLSAVAPLPVNPCGIGSSITGTTFLIMVGGNLLAGESCVFDVDIQVPASAIDNSYSNITSNLTATQGGAVVVDPATDNLVVESNLIQLTKQFLDDPVTPGELVTLEFVLSNLDLVQSASMIDFTDDLGVSLAGLTFDSVLVNDCGATLSGTGTSLITVQGASLAADGSCTIRTSLTVPVSANPGIYINTTSTVNGEINSLAVTGAPATDVLEVIDSLLFSKAFLSPSTATGTVNLQFTLLNPGSSTANSVSFNDDLDAVISGLVATGLPLNNVCGAGSVLSGTSFLTLTGAELSAMESCIIDVTLSVPGSATAGIFMNVTSDLTSSGLKVADPATADLTIEPPPTFAKAFAPDTIGSGLTSNLTFTIDNTASTLAANNLDFTDNLPPGISVATPTVANNTCGGTLTATAGASTISLSGSSVGAGATCTIDVAVTSSTVGSHVNTTSDLTSSSGNSGTASDTLTVVPQPGFAKVFAPNPILVGGTSSLTLTIDNSGSSVSATILNFTDDLPTDMLISTPSNAATTCTGGTLTATDGSTTINYTGGSVAAGSSCTVSVDVTTNTAGSFANTTTTLASSLGSSLEATDTLVVNGPPAFSKQFINSVISTTVGTQLEFTIDNTASTVAATALDFTDNMPAAILVDAIPGVINSCGTGTVTAVAGTSVVSYTGGTIAAGASCSILVNVNSSTVGAHVNLSGDLTSSSGNSGTATDTLSVSNLPVFSKAFLENPILINEVTQLTFTINNSAGTLDITGMSFMDNIPVGLEISNPVDNCSGSVITTPNSVDYSGGSVLSGGTCTITVDVTATTSGSFDNMTTALSTNWGLSNMATDTLVVDPVLGFSKAFVPNAIQPDGVSQLQFVFDNTLSTIDATGVNFTDNLPTGVIVSNPPNFSITCSSITIDAFEGESTITLFDANVLAGTSCMIQVDVTSSDLGTHVNTTEDLTSSHGNSGTASATLYVTNAPTISKEFTDNPTLIGVVNPLGFTIDNSMNTIDVTDLAFTDPLPTGLEIANPANIQTDCIGGVVTANPADTTITYTGGTVSASSSCGISVNVVATTSGTFNNMTSILTTSLGDSNMALDDLSVDAAPIVMKSFTPNAIPVNGVSQLDITIDNTLGGVDVTSLILTDNLPVDTIIATPNNASTTCIGGTITTSDGIGSISYGGGTVPFGTSCIVSVDVTSSVLGTHVNTTNDIVSSHGNSGTATAELLVTNLPTLSKVFNNPSFVLDTVNTLVFTIDNTMNIVDVTDLAFDDPMPAGLEIANPANVTNNCNGTVTANPTESTINYSLGSVSAFSTCTISVDTIATIPGLFTNTTTALSTSLGVSNSAIATLQIAPVPSVDKSFNPTAIPVNGVSQLTVSIDNAMSSLLATDINVTDNLPPGMIIATPANVSTTCIGGTVTAVSDSGVLNYSGGSVLANTQCSITVNVTASVSDTYVNTTEDITSNHGNSGIATAELLVTNTPTLTKEFTNNPFVQNTDNPLLFTIDNSMNIIDVTDLSFNDPLPVGMVVANPSNATTTCVGGSLSAAGSSISYTGGTVLAQSTCTISVNVITTTTGEFFNETSVLSTSLGESNVATDTLVINQEPTVSKSFTPTSIAPNGVSQLQLSIDNSNSDLMALNLSVTDNLPVGMVVATPSNLNNSCTGGTLTAVSGTAVVSYSGGVVPQNSSCSISVDVTSSITGNHVNLTSDFITNHGNSGTATADLTVGSAPLFSALFAPDLIVEGGISQLIFTIDNGANNLEANTLDFTNNLPANLLVANPANASSTCTGGSIGATSGSSVISYSGGSVPALSSCQVTVDVSSPTSGLYTNTSGNLTSSQGMSGVATATLSVEFGLSATKIFTSTHVTAGETINLEFTVTNNSSIPASMLSISDDLNTFVPGSTAVNLPQNNVCGSGSVLQGTGNIVLTNGSLAANSSCQFMVDVLIPEGTDEGSYNNITSAVTGNFNGSNVNGSAASVATASLYINGFSQVIPLLDHWIILMILIVLMLSVGHIYLKPKR